MKMVALLPPFRKTRSLMGARNENSVLFSLSALTDSKDAAPAASATTATTEGSGLIDIRALSASTSGGQKDSRVDDIMNLGGGGAFTPALTAPVLAPVSPDAMGDFLGGSSGETGAPGNKKMMYIIMGSVGLILVMFVVLIVFSNVETRQCSGRQRIEVNANSNVRRGSSNGLPGCDPRTSIHSRSNGNGSRNLKSPQCRIGRHGRDVGWNQKVATSGAGEKKPTEY